MHLPSAIQYTKLLYSTFSYPVSLTRLDVQQPCSNPARTRPNGAGKARHKKHRYRRKNTPIPSQGRGRH